MRFLSIINYPYYRPGGGLVTMRALYHQLARRGHRVVAIHTFAAYSPVIGRDADNRASAVAFLAKHGIAAVPAPGGALRFSDGPVDVHYVEDAEAIGPYLDRLLPELAPDWVQLAAHETEVIGEAVLARLDRGPDGPAKLLFTCHASEGLPFGPRAMHRGPRTLDHMRACRAIWVPSLYVQRYLAEHAGLTSTVLPIDVYGARPFRRLGAWDRGAVTLVNSSLPKGLPIFLDLARAFPGVPFATVPTWEMGVAPNDPALAELPANVALVPPVANPEIDRIYEQVRVLVAPSLLHEAFGLVVVEAMLRGIPVLASDVGGLPEAKLGVPYLLPVASIDWNADTRTWYEPPQDLAPWREALGALLADRAHYEAIAERSRAAAHAFVEAIADDGFERFLDGVR